MVSQEANCATTDDTHEGSSEGAIFYYKGYTLYRLPGIRNWETNKTVDGTEACFINKENSKSGYLYRPCNDSGRGIRMETDSFFAKNIVDRRMIQPPPDSLWNLVAKDKIDGMPVERYAPKKRGDETGIDSICLYFNKKYKQLPFSFSMDVDNSRNMKLYKIRAVQDEKYSAANHVTMPKRDFVVEILERPVDDETRIRRWMDYFREAILR